jgi:hypothetical protein
MSKESLLRSRCRVVVTLVAACLATSTVMGAIAGAFALPPAHWDASAEDNAMRPAVQPARFAVQAIEGQSIHRSPPWPRPGALNLVNPTNIIA